MVDKKKKHHKMFKFICRVRVEIW